MVLWHSLGVLIILHGKMERFKFVSKLVDHVHHTCSLFFSDHEGIFYHGNVTSHITGIGRE